MVRKCDIERLEKKHEGIIEKSIPIMRSYVDVLTSNDYSSDLMLKAALMKRELEADISSSSYLLSLLKNTVYFGDKKSTNTLNDLKKKLEKKIITTEKLLIKTEEDLINCSFKEMGQTELILKAAELKRERSNYKRFLDEVSFM